MRIRRLPSGSAPANIVKIVEELENASPHSFLAERKSIDRELFLTGEWRTVGGRHELTSFATPERPLWLPGDFPDGVYAGSSGPPNPDIINPGNRIADEPYTITFPKGGRYRLESEWGVLCGNTIGELRERKFRSSLEIEVPEGTFDAPAGLQLRMRRLPNGDAPPDTAKIADELENTSASPIFVAKQSIDRDLFVTGQWQVNGGRRELTRYAKPETPTFLAGGTWQGSFYGGGRVPYPEIVKPGRRIGNESYELTLEEGRFQLDSEWTVLCGNSPENLAKCKVRSSLEIVVPEGKDDAPAAIDRREK